MKTENAPRLGLELLFISVCIVKLPSYINNGTYSWTLDWTQNANEMQYAVKHCYPQRH